MTTAPTPPPSSAPPPPPGPGVQAPFVAPPTDGARQRRWWAVGLSVGVAVLCCVGGLFGTGGLVVLGGRMVIDSTRAVVIRHLTAVRRRPREGVRADLRRRAGAARRNSSSPRSAQERPITFEVDQPIIGSVRPDPPGHAAVPTAHPRVSSNTVQTSPPPSSRSAGARANVGAIARGVLVRCRSTSLRVDQEGTATSLRVDQESTAHESAS
jgi:hypothetical protein